MSDKSEQLPNHSILTSLIDFMAGSLGGAAAIFVSQPFDTIKVRMQTYPEIYKGMIECGKNTFINDGFRQGLYAGTLPAIIANVAENSVLFAAYGFCQNLVARLNGKSSTRELTTLDNAVSGFLAAFFSTFALCPTELIKCKLQAQKEIARINNTRNYQYLSPYRLTRLILKEEGLRGMYRGLIPTACREMPGYFFFFGGYEGTRELLKTPNQKKDEIGLLKTMLAGAVGGICLWTTTFPADVIKSRMQINNLKTGMLKTGIVIIEKEGVLALYNGLLPTIFRTIPATAALFVVYEYSKKAMAEVFK